MEANFQLSDLGVDQYTSMMKDDYLPMITDYSSEAPKYYKYGYSSI